jgi:hypothetical protein
VESLVIKKMLVTPQQAEIWLQSNIANRKVRDHWVDLLASQIKDGNWLLTHQGIALSKSGILLDGQHRLMAIKKANIAVEMFVCFDADESTFKAIDSGIRRSMADLTKLNRLESEVASRLCKIIFNGRNITPENVMLIGSSAFFDIHKKLMDVCNSRSRYYSSVNSRTAACLAIELGSSFDYVSNTYADLNRMDVQNLPTLAAALVKQVAMNNIASNNHGDALARCFKVFDEKNKNLTRLLVSDQDIKETFEKVRYVFLDKYNIGEQ